MLHELYVPNVDIYPTAKDVQCQFPSINKLIEN